MNTEHSQATPGTPRVTVQMHNGWAVLALSNPPRGTFDSRCERELAQALDQVLDLAHVRVVVLTGAQPGMFVRHYDVEALERRGRTLVERGLQFSPETPPDEGGFHRCLRRLTSCGRLVIAAINGTCMGGGLELALACQLRYASEGDYLLGLPEVQLGLLPGAGGTQRLGRAVGEARALEMLLLGTCVSPARAAQLGLVHAVVPDALAHAAAVAQVLARRPAELLAQIVQLHALGAQGDPRGEAMERGAFAQALRSPYALQAMADVNAGRRPFPEAER